MNLRDKPKPWESEDPDDWTPAKGGMITPGVAELCQEKMAALRVLGVDMTSPERAHFADMLRKLTRGEYYLGETLSDSWAEWIEKTADRIIREHQSRPAKP